MENVTATVKIEPKIINSRKAIRLSWSYQLGFKDYENGNVSCYIPSFDIYFHATDKEKAAAKGKIIMNMLFDHLIYHNKKDLLGSIAIHLHKLGFKTNNDMQTMAKLIRKEAVKANFQLIAKNIPEEFKQSELVHQETELDIAV